MTKKRVFWSGGILFMLLFSTMLFSQPLFQVTQEAAEVTCFAWSPDGTQFVYMAVDGQIAKVYRIDLDGSNRFLLDERTGGNVDWKGDYIIYRKYVEGAPVTYDYAWMRTRPDGSDKLVLTAADWYSDGVLRQGGNWMLFRFAPNGWWQAKKVDLNGNNESVVSHNSLLQGIGWLGKNHVLYARGWDYNTTCGIYKVDFNGGNLEQLTPETLPSDAQFAASPDSGKILYCDGSSSDWNI